MSVEVLNMHIKTDSVGTVCWFNDSKGFGFIQADDGQLYFAHYSEIVSKAKRRTLWEGARVTFDSKQTDTDLLYTMMRKEPLRAHAVKENA